MASRIDNSPRVTVVVTCFNQAHWIERSLRSVAEQTESNLKLVVTDDGSMDGSPNVIREWLHNHWADGELVASTANRGLPATLNRALPHLAGDYVVVLNGDDWMEPDRIQRQADFLDELPAHVGVVYSRLRVVDETGEPTGAEAPKPENIREGTILADLIENIDLGMPTLMVRRSVFDQVGHWDESLVADDFDLVLRIAAAGFEFRYLPIVAVNYRVSQVSMTQSRAGELIESRFRAIKKVIGRHPEVRDVAWRRLEGLTVALHGGGYDRRVVRSQAWYVIRHRPTKRLVRVLLESLLGLPSGRLSLGGRA